MCELRRDLMESLTPQEKLVIQMRYYHDATPEEIRHTMKLKETVVYDIIDTFDRRVEASNV